MLPMEHGDLAVNEPIRIGILGAAKIAPISIFAPAKNRPAVQVVAIAARDHARAQAMARVHDVPHALAGYETLIARDDIDLVHVALPASLHAEWSIRALEAGKAVLCEKPFAVNAYEARAMVAAAERAGRPLIEAFHYRFHPAITEALSLIRGGAIGAPQSGEAIFDVPIAYSETEFRWRPEMGGGALMDLGCYCVHALRQIGGEPAVAEASAAMVRGVDETTRAELAFPGGFVARLQTSMAGGGLKAGLRVQGEAGSLEVTNFMAPQVGCRFTLERNGETDVLPVDPGSSFAWQLDHVIAVMRGEAEPLTGGADAISNMAAIDAIRERAADRRDA